MGRAWADRVRQLSCVPTSRGVGLVSEARGALLWRVLWRLLGRGLSCLVSRRAERRSVSFRHSTVEDACDESATAPLQFA